MSRTDPLQIEMVLQGHRFAVGANAIREQLAERLSREGMKLEDLHLLLAYFEDRGRKLDDWRGVAWKMLNEPGKWQTVVTDLRASTAYAGEGEAEARRNLALSGGPSNECRHGVAASMHCESCHPQTPLGDELLAMRENSLESLISWIIRDYMRKSEDSTTTHERMRSILRRHFTKPQSVTTEERGEIDRHIIPHALQLRIAENQRFPGEKVRRMNGSQMSEANWVADANAATRGRCRTGPLVGQTERIEDWTPKQAADSDEDLGPIYGQPKET
jgi:hypothetical protein